MRKKMLSVLLAVSMLLSLYIPAGASAATDAAEAADAAAATDTAAAADEAAAAVESVFSDVSGHWGEAAIGRWSGYGIVVGDRGKFRPDASLTRAELATILSKTLGLSDEGEGIPFKDVPENAWYTKYIRMVATAGIMAGYDNNTARPDRAVTRQEATTLMCKALGILPSQSTEYEKFPDAADVDPWAIPFVSAMVDKGIINGVVLDTTTTVLWPLAEINRASIMAILNNAIVQYINEAGTYEMEKEGGIILVAAGGVTLTGESSADVLIAQGADGETVRFQKAKLTGELVVQAENAKVIFSSDSTMPEADKIRKAEDSTTVTKESRTSGGGSSSGGGGGGEENSTDVKVNDNVYEIHSDISDKKYTTLTIGKEVGDGSITLTNVTADTLNIQGGGDGTVTLDGCDIKNVVVNKDTTSDADVTEDVRILLKGSSLESLTASSNVILESDGQKGEQVSKLSATAAGTVLLKGATAVEELEIPASATVTLDWSYTGSVEKATMSDGAALDSSSDTTGSVKTLATSGKVDVGAKVDTIEAASGSDVNLTDGAKVGTIEANEGNVAVSAETGAEVSVNAVETSKALTLNQGVFVKKIVASDGASVSGSGKAESMDVTGAVTVDSQTVSQVTMKGAGSVTASNTVDATNPLSVEIDTAEAVTVPAAAAVSQTANVTTVNATTDSGETAKIITWNTTPTAGGVPATCTKPGYEIYTVFDDDTITKKVPTAPTGHEWKIDTVPATCTTTGTKTYTCQHTYHDTAVDGENPKVVTLPMLSHYVNPTNTTYHHEVDAEGKDEYHWQICDGCDTVKVNKAAHNLVTVVDGDKIYNRCKQDGCDYEEEVVLPETVTYLTLEENKLISSYDRAFYGQAGALNPQSVVISSTLPFASGASAVENWTVADSARNVYQALTLTSVSASGTTATLTFTPVENQVVSGALYIMPGAACFEEGVTVYDNEPATAGVPAPEVAAIYTVSVTRDENDAVAVSVTEAVGETDETTGETTTRQEPVSGVVYYYPATSEQVDELRSVVKANYRRTAQIQLEEIFGQQGSEKAPTAEALVDNTYLVAAKYTDGELDGYGVSAKIVVAAVAEPEPEPTPTPTKELVKLTPAIVENTNQITFDYEADDESKEDGHAYILSALPDTAAWTTETTMEDIMTAVETLMVQDAQPIFLETGKGVTFEVDAQYKDAKLLIVYTENEGNKLTAYGTLDDLTTLAETPAPKTMDTIEITLSDEQTITGLKLKTAGTDLQVSSVNYYLVEINAAENVESGLSISTTLNDLTDSEYLSNVTEAVTSSEYNISSMGNAILFVLYFEDGKLAAYGKQELTGSEETETVEDVVKDGIQRANNVMTKLDGVSLKYAQMYLNKGDKITGAENEIVVEILPATDSGITEALKDAKVNTIKEDIAEMIYQMVNAHQDSVVKLTNQLGSEDSGTESFTKENVTLNQENASQDDLSKIVKFVTQCFKSGEVHNFKDAGANLWTLPDTLKNYESGVSVVMKDSTGSEMTPVYYRIVFRNALNNENQTAFTSMNDDGFTGNFVNQESTDPN